MYLKEIIAQGFKSFADKTIIKLDKNITGIVGPNGSGKSNVVDAVRWVLGEQSVKSLRGSDNMTDVIFAGSKSRKALNVASVTLVFDNTDHYLPLSYDEVSIKRRCYMDGTNEFFIGEEKVRLKDIQNLFMDSGIGKDSFNIISQGKVEAILSDKPEDRRIIFEEAAGVLKYKKRKIDALKKLEKTNNNLDRINDIIKELEVQVEPLSIASTKTNKYNELSSELEGIEISLITNDITIINEKYKTSKKLVEELKNEILAITTSNSSNEATIEEYKLKIAKIDEALESNQVELLNVTSEVEKLNSKKTLVLEREKYNVEDSKLHDNIVNLKESLLKNENSLSELEREINDIENNIKEISLKIDKYNKDIDKVKENKEKEELILSNYNKEESKLKNEIARLEEDIDNYSSLPFSVKAVLNNPKLIGIHDTLANILDTDSKYMEAISVSLGSSSSYIICDNEASAKDAIEYLKTNNIGRATFLPLNVIKPKGLDIDTLNMIKDINGYIGISSDLVSYDKRFRNIILNQLGNVIVVDNIDTANKVAKKIQNRYRIVTLEGEIINVGGSITGGKNKIRNIISDKYELDKKNHLLDELVNKIKDEEELINKISDDFKFSEDKLYSNGEQCKKREDISNVVKVYYDKFYTKDNKICLMQYDMDNNYKFDCNKDEKNVDSYLIRKDDIKKVLQSIYAPSKNDTYYYYYFVIKTDGKLYKEEVTQKYFSDKYNISKEEVYLDSDKYGKIIDIDASYDYDNKELIIRKLLTENGLYILQENKTEECIKFEDIACKKELKKNDVLEKYKDSIKYFGTQKIVTKNNAIFSTDDFINKELIEFK